MIKVSVVVPVYNGGDYLERCAPSLLKQSLSQSEYEVIYVDDGSTDNSVARLERLAETAPHLRWTTQRNSGWPGKPRNVGVKMARGEFIQFVDQDDELAHEALERLYALGSANGADIVLGKLAGSMAGPNEAFRRTVTRGTLADTPAIHSMTGHKMFRRAFLLEHDIRFPEGYWRMEDLLFVARAYAKAQTISILADYPCYFWHRRDDGLNNSLAKFDLAGHYQRLRIVIAALRDGTAPGEVQDRLLRRLYQVEVMSRAERTEAFELCRGVALDSFPSGVREGMAPIQRVRAELLESGEFDSLIEWSRRMKTLQPKLSVSAVALGDDGAVRFRLNAHLSDTKGQTLAVRPSEEGFQLDPALLDGLPLEPFDIADPRSSSGGAIQLHDAERQVWWYPETELAPHTAAATDGTLALVVAGEVMIDPTRAADGHPLPAGRYVVWFRGTFLGLGRRRRIPIRGSVQGMDGWTLTGDGLLATRLRRSSDDRLELEVKDGPALLGRKIRPATRSARACGNRAVPIRMGRCVASAPVPVRLELWKSTGPRTLVDAILNTTGDGAVIELPERVSLSRGTYVLGVVGGATPLARVRTRGGRVIAVYPPGESRWRSALRRTARRVLMSSTRQAAAAIDRLHRTRP